MDTLEKYRAIIRKIIPDYACPKAAYGQIESETIVDPERDHYEVMAVGWHEHRRVHGCVIHLDIIDGKIWIQHDGTDRPVASELLAAGVPREDIVLAFHPPDLRQYTEFGVG